MRRAHATGEFNHHHAPNGAGGMQHQVLEEENERLTENLRGKVQALKSLSIDIGQEVRQQNKLLNEMDDDFDAGGSLLSSTMNHLTALTKKGHHKIMCYLFLFCLFVFFVAWFIIRSR